MNDSLMPRMNKVHLEYFRNLLLSERQRLLQQLNRVDFARNFKEFKGDDSIYHDSMADIGTDTNERDKLFLFASRETRTLNLIEEALLRINRGSYGLCLECQEPIAQARLRSIPYASLCLDCKAERERQ